MARDAYSHYLSAIVNVINDSRVIYYGRKIDRDRHHLTGQHVIARYTIEKFLNLTLWSKHGWKARRQGQRSVPPAVKQREDLS